MGDPHSNPNTMRTFALACVFLAVAITALPADDLVAEALPADTEVAAPDTELYVQQLHKEASNDVAALIEAGKTKDACAKLADSSIKEITDGQRNTQRLVNRMDVGKNCHTAGLAAYNAAKSRETSARNAYHSANNAYNRAKGARVKTSPFTVSKVKANGCLDVSKDSAYIAAKRHVTTTNNNKIRKKAAYDNSRKATADALKAHQKAKVACACRAQKNHKAAVKATSNFNSSKNAKACAKGHISQHALVGGSHFVYLQQSTALQNDNQSQQQCWCHQATLPWWWVSAGGRWHQQPLPELECQLCARGGLPTWQPFPVRHGLRSWPPDVLCHVLQEEWDAV